MRTSSRCIVFFLYFAWFTFAQLLILSLLFLNYSSFNLSFDYVFRSFLHYHKGSSTFSSVYFGRAWIDIYGHEGCGVMKGYLTYIDHYFSHDEMAEKIGLCII